MKLGQRFGKYEILERIAYGGMSEVFLARMVGIAGFSKLVVVKRLHPRLSEDPDLVQMLVDEARLSSQLDHANIGQVLDLGRLGTTYYLAMEYIDGRDLFAMLRALEQQRRRLPPPAVARIGVEIAAALDYAHRKCGADGSLLGIIHRDVSPPNVLVTFEGEVKLIDFGIAKARTRAVQTQSGIVRGKYRYMSLEQARGEPIDGRSDVYSLGVILHELASGRPYGHQPGDVEQQIQIQMQMQPAPGGPGGPSAPLAGRFAPLAELRPDLPADLLRLVETAMHPELARRFQSAGALLLALEAVLRRLGDFPKRELGRIMRELFAEEAAVTAAGSGIREQAAIDVARRRVRLRGRRPRPEEAVVELSADDLEFVDQEETTGVEPVDLLTAPAASESNAGAGVRAGGVAGVRPGDPQPPVEEATATLSAPEALRRRMLESMQAAVPPGGADAQATPDQSPFAADTEEVVIAAPRRGRLVRGTMARLAAPERHSRVTPKAVALVAFLGVVILGGLFLLDPAGRRGLRAPAPGSTVALPHYQGSGDPRRQPAAARLVVESVPSGAAIGIDGRDTGLTTPDTVDQLDSGRTYRLQLSRPGYELWELEITPVAGQLTPVAAALRKPQVARAGRPRAAAEGGSGRPLSSSWPASTTAAGSASPGSMATETGRVEAVGGFLEVESLRAGRVVVNGVDVGSTPRLIKRLRQGRYSVRMRYPDGTISDQQEVVIGAGSQSRLRFAD